MGEPRPSLILEQIRATIVPMVQAVPRLALWRVAAIGGDALRSNTRECIRPHLEVVLHTYVLHINVLLTALWWVGPQLRISCPRLNVRGPRPCVRKARSGTTHGVCR